MQAAASFKITVCGIEELSEHCKARVSHVVSILDPAWPVPPALDGYRDYERLELRFDDVIEPMPGKAPPAAQHIRELLALGRRLMAEPAPTRHLLIHCGAGFSRSPAAVALLLAQTKPPLAPGAIADEVLRLRPTAWPNLRMIELGDSLLKRRGELVEAASRIYRHRLANQPGLAELMMGNGREREVEAGRG
ncbi:MAG: protein-tyrosine-phosphatase [Acetobacteraceae bacterium]|nr:protein-tyrosine-phosphatase [Acetobacteraceae bacterium]